MDLDNALLSKLIREWIEAIRTPINIDAVNELVHYVYTFNSLTKPNIKICRELKTSYSFGKVEAPIFYQNFYSYFNDFVDNNFVSTNPFHNWSTVVKQISIELDSNINELSNRDRYYYFNLFSLYDICLRIEYYKILNNGIRDNLWNLIEIIKRSGVSSVYFNEHYELVFYSNPYIKFEGDDNPDFFLYYTNIIQGFENATLMWPDYTAYKIKGVIVPEKVALSPDKLTVEDINNTLNAEVRRLMIERYPTSRYVAESDLKVVDFNTGGILKCLLKSNNGDAWLVATDGSTKRVYYMPVNPYSKNCTEAHQSICGFDPKLIKMEG